MIGRNIRCLDIFFLCVFVAFAFVLISPWQVVINGPTDNKYFRILLEIFLVICAIYFFKRSSIYSNRKKYVIRFFSILFITVCGVHIYLKSSIKAPAQYNYATFYSNPNNSLESIKVWHNHGFLHSWNETKHVIEFPKWGLRLEKNFNLQDLNGVWFVHENNPSLNPEGIANFKNGLKIQ